MEKEAKRKETKKKKWSSHFCFCSWGGSEGGKKVRVLGGSRRKGKKGKKEWEVFCFVLAGKEGAFLFVLEIAQILSHTKLSSVLPNIWCLLVIYAKNPTYKTRIISSYKQIWTSNRFVMPWEALSPSGDNTLPLPHISRISGNCIKDGYLLDAHPDPHSKTGLLCSKGTDFITNF